MAYKLVTGRSVTQDGKKWTYIMNKAEITGQTRSVWNIFVEKVEEEDEIVGLK